MRGGRDRHDIRPIRRDGKFGDDEIGTHRGTFECLNVQSPEPGMHYYWAPRNGRRAMAKLRSLRRRGFRVIQEGDPEFVTESPDPDFAAAGLDSSMGIGDVVLMKAPISVVRAYKAQKARERQARQQSAAEGNQFLDQGADLKREFGGADDIYVRRPDHRTHKE